MKLTDQQKHDQLKAAGLLDSTFTQLTRYYGQLLRLDFGTSRRIQSGVSVVKVIGGKFAMSMQLGLISFAISLVIGVVMGVGRERRDRCRTEIKTEKPGEKTLCKATKKRKSVDDAGRF